MSQEDRSEWSKAVWDNAIETETGEGVLFFASWYYALNGR